MSKRVSSDHGSHFQAYYPGPCQTVAFDGSVESTAFGINVTLIRVFSTEDCFLVFAPTPTASSAGLFLPGGIVDYIGVKPGYKVAAIKASIAGLLYITECS